MITMVIIYFFNHRRFTVALENLQVINSSMNYNNTIKKYRLSMQGLNT